jgi:hypothetical protein
MNREEHIYNILVSHLNSIFENFPFFIAYQNNSKNYKKYGTVYNISRVTKQERKSYFDRANPHEQQERLNKYFLQIDLYSNADNLMSYADTIISNLKSDKTIYYFEKHNIFLGDTTSVRNLPERYKNKWRYRRSFDIEIMVVEVDVFSVEHITSVDIQKSP